MREQKARKSAAPDQRERKTSQSVVFLFFFLIAPGILLGRID